MPYFRRDDIEFYFEERGSGRSFVFSHGLGGKLDQVGDLIGELPNIRLILYDNRAHGRTRPIGDPSKLTFADMADDMAALLDYLAIPSAFIGGVSMGAGIALAFALRHRQRAKALVLSRPAWLDHPNPPNLSVLPFIAKLVEELGQEQALRTFQEMGLYRDFQKNYPETARSLRDVILNQRVEALVASFRAIPASAPVDSLDELRDLNIPSLVLGNRNDPLHPFEFAEALAAALPAARLREFPSKSESLMEHQRQFRQLVAEFLRTID